jgi:branched-subunit amino acid aminotransferase/4-amino-4-deoxychorismate lyase
MVQSQTMLEPYIFFDGKIILLSQARVSPDDLGMLRGYAVYEGITSFNGVPFHFSEHWKRLCASAHAIGITAPLTEQDAYNGLVELISKNSPESRSVIRVVLSGGPAEDGLRYIKDRSLFYMLCEPLTPLPSTFYEQGASLITHEYSRFMPLFKTTAYITAVTLQEKRREAGAVEILYTKNGYVFECATSNIAIVKDGIIITPKEGVLEGITLAIALTLARENGIPVEERAVSCEELLIADEVFIASSFKDVVPVVRIDEKTIGDGEPGEITEKVAHLFREHTEIPS